MINNGTGCVAQREFSDIYRTQKTFVMSKLRRCGVRERDLADISQEVFLILWTKLHTYDRSRRVRPWLGGIARRIASDYRRRAAYRRELAAQGLETLSALIDATPDAGAPDAEIRLETSQREDLVRQALGRLDPARREVLAMHDWDDIAIATIADVQRVPVATAWSRLHSARKKVGLTIVRLRAREERTQTDGGTYELWPRWS